MPKLIIRHKGKIIQEVCLTADKEIFVGRGAESDIVLPKAPGISRRHLALSPAEEEGKWNLKNLSQSCELSIEGNVTEEGLVGAGEFFQAGDFQFHLLEEAKPPASAQPSPKALSDSLESAEKSPVPAGYKTESQINEIEEKKNNESDAYSEEAGLPALAGADGKTQMVDMSSPNAGRRLSAYLKVSYDDDTPRDIFKLSEEESEWVFGRDESADIMIESPNVSREHFRITREENGQYYIKDLKSSNGTLLNDKELSSGKAYPLRSGYMIYILDIEIAFEIKDLVLEKELAGLKAPPPAPVQYQASGPPGVYGEAAPPFNSPLPAHLPGVVVEMPEEKGASFLKNKKRLLIYGGIAALVLAAFFLGGKEEKTTEQAEGKTQKTLATGELAGLSDEQAGLVKDIYTQAQQLYTQGKFEYCLSEIKKIHGYTNSYRNSKKLEVACAQAADNQKRQHDLEQKRKKEEDTEKLIRDITYECNKKFDTFEFKHDLTSCLDPAIELAPADSRIYALIERFDAIQIEKEEQKQKAIKRKQLIKSVFKKYTYAKSLYKSGKVLKAMSAYQHFINISSHRELKSARKTAQRELAAIKKNFNDKNNKMSSECENEFKAGRFKKAYYTCKTASKKIPVPHNQKALTFKTRAREKLEVSMKPIYESAGLNESVGQVDAAKEDWNKILSQDVDTGLYYNRAKEKLNKY